MSEKKYKVFDQMHPGVTVSAVMRERKYQDEKYGPVMGDGGHDLTGWLIVMQKELNEAMDAATGHGKRNRTGRHTVRAEIIQLAAVCFAALEQHGHDPFTRLCTGTGFQCEKGCGTGELCLMLPAT